MAGTRDTYRIARVRRLPKFNAQAGYSVQNSTNASAAFWFLA